MVANYVNPRTRIVGDDIVQDRVCVAKQPNTTSFATPWSVAGDGIVDDRIATEPPPSVYPVAEIVGDQIAKDQCVNVIIQVDSVFRDNNKPLERISFPVIVQPLALSV